MAMHKIKKGDTIVVLVGRDKGKTGAVTRVIIDPTTRRVSRVLVEGINLVHKNVKANPQRNVEAGVILIEKPLHVSNVALFNPVTKRADRVGIKEVNGKKERFFKSNGEIVNF